MDKPGIKTTEFWLTTLQALVGPVVAILVVFGVVNPDVDATALTEGTNAAVKDAVAGLTALVALWRSATVVTSYTEQRTAAKHGTGD